MTEPIATLAVDFADYPEGFEARTRQHRCITHLMETAPDNFKVIIGTTRKGATMLVVWPRSGYPTHSQKAVPFVRDILDYTTEQKSFYGGFINSDIILHPAAYDRIREARDEGVDAILLHRTDVKESEVKRFLKTDNPGMVPAGTKVARGRSIDGLFITRDAWMLMRDGYPDFVTGEPYWDTAMIHILNGAKGALKLKSLRSNEVLHVKHPCTWAFGTPGAAKASAMFGELVEKTRAEKQKKRLTESE